MEASKPRPAPPAEIPARDDVRLVASRCPFCREQVAAVESVACQGCLARHHPACWDESGRCAACGTRQALRPEKRAITRGLVRELLAEAGFGAEAIEAYFAADGSEPIQARCQQRTQGVLCNRPAVEHFHASIWVCTRHASQHQRQVGLALGALALLIALAGLVCGLIGAFDDPDAFVVAALLAPISLCIGAVAAWSLRRARQLAERARDEERREERG